MSDIQTGSRVRLVGSLWHKNVAGKFGRVLFRHGALPVHYLVKLDDRTIHESLIDATLDHIEASRRINNE